MMDTTTIALTPGFQAVPEGSVLFDRRDMPRVYRGLVAHWPAVKHWSVAYLADMAPDMPVELVAGNRERHDTRFVSSTLRGYLASLQGLGELAGQSLYLKEFDLLKAMPRLHKDLRYTELFPRGVMKSVQSWIGPPKASTGLHYDYPDNLAAQIVGKKRFHLARPGAVERMGAVSKKYDAWAVLASSGIAELAARSQSLHPGKSDFFVVDLAPGDVMHVPRGWWHEVSNLSTSVSFGGFYGGAIEGAAVWARVSARKFAHRMGWLGRGDCTCCEPTSAARDACASS